jgi:ribonucleoside-diphosphate reductase alpha chain
MEEFKNNPIGLSIYRHKYALNQSQTWKEKARTIVEDVCGHGTYGQYRQVLMSKEERQQLQKYIEEMKFLPGGRYVYYAGRQVPFWNNCYLLRAEEDTREEWSAVTQRAMSCLMTGGGIGIDYSRLREYGRTLSRTGGVASGPIPLMYCMNEIGRNVMQGGSRRSAIYASLQWSHPDVQTFLKAKEWSKQPIGTALKSDGSQYTYFDYKHDDFNAPASLDMTNVSLNWDDEWLREPERETNPIFVDNVRYAMMNGEPGFSFNFGLKSNETLRNACTEVTSEDDSDVCNLGSVNMAACKNQQEFADVVRLASKFLVCGTIRADLPYAKVYQVREKNRRLGLGIMGVHAWLLARGYRYEMNEELRSWLSVYKSESESAANEHCDRFYLSRPVAYRAIAPTGTISMIAGTTSGIEPLYAVAYKRRYLTQGTRWMYEYKIDAVAQMMVEQHGVDPDSIETAIDLARDPERRIAFQADVQEYVDMGISSTLNLPAWGSPENNPDRVESFAYTVSKYAPRLRGLTFYPDGSRGGQPLTKVPYTEAHGKEGVAYEENGSCRDGVCGL